MNTFTLTTAQAIVRYLAAQYTIVDGKEVRLFVAVLAFSAMAM